MCRVSDAVGFYPHECDARKRAMTTSSVPLNSIDLIPVLEWRLNRQPLREPQGHRSDRDPTRDEISGSPQMRPSARERDTRPTRRSPGSFLRGKGCDTSGRRADTLRQIGAKNDKKKLSLSKGIALSRKPEAGPRGRVRDVRTGKDFASRILAIQPGLSYASIRPLMIQFWECCLFPLIHRDPSTFPAGLSLICKPPIRTVLPNHFPMQGVWPPLG